jgi:hypothetical protein
MTRSRSRKPRTEATPVPAQRERVVAVQALRRSSAAQPHRNRTRYHRPSQARATTREDS